MITSYVDTPTFDGLKDEILLGLLAAYEIDKIIDASLRCVQLRGLSSGGHCRAKVGSAILTMPAAFEVKLEESQLLLLFPHPSGLSK